MSTILLREAYANPPWQTREWMTVEYVAMLMGYRIGRRGLSQYARNATLSKLKVAGIPRKKWAGEMVYKGDAVRAYLGEARGK